MANEIEKNWWVFPGFKIEHVVNGLNLPVNIVFVENPKDKPDAPLFYVTELYGQIKAITNDHTIHTYAENLLNYEPDYTIPRSGESGVTGICIEPETGALFVLMIYADGEDTKAKIIRTKSRDGLKMDSIETFIDDIPSIKGAHQIQSLTIGSDGKLYVNMGDVIIEPRVAQDDKNLRGKILRMNPDGSIPEDNPNPDSLIYAKGFRNPFGGVWRQKDDSLYITDNGPFVDDSVAR